MGMTKINDGLLSQTAFFGNLPGASRKAFVDAGHACAYAKRRTIVILGDPADRLFVVMSGWVKLYRMTPAGDETVLALLTCGEIFGEGSIFGGASYPFSAEAIEDTELFEIPDNVLREQARFSPEVMSAVVNAMANEIESLQNRNQQLVALTAPQRVGNLLLHLSADMLGDGGTFTLPYDKSLAAARQGMTSETFSRALKQLRRAGVRVRGSEITIDSFSSLDDYCCGRHVSDSARDKAMYRAASPEAFAPNSGNPGFAGRAASSLNL